jgi:hypothetical protein
VIIALAAEAEDFTAEAGHSVQVMGIDFDTISAINSRTKLIVSIGCNEQFTKLLFVLL